LQKYIETIRYKKLVSAFIFLIISLTFWHPLFSQEMNDFAISSPSVVLSRVPFSIKLKSNVIDSLEKTSNQATGSAEIELYIDSIRIKNYKFEKTENALILSDLKTTRNGKQTLYVKVQGNSNKVQILSIPGILSLLPPILAIILALLARQVFISLFCGIWLGASILTNYNPLLGFLRTIDKYLIESLSDPSHIAIVIFSMTLGGMVGVISKSGGTRGIVLKLSKFANNRRGGLLGTWAMGVLIFFDDYANTLVVGNTMRPFTDKLLISREKLSYIVDSTAAPVASIALISSWVGFQVGLIDGVFKSLDISADSYLIFIKSIPYSIYSILAIIFVFITSITLKDLFLMRRAEYRAYNNNELLSGTAQPLVDTASTDFEPVDNADPRWYNALIPITLVILTTMAGLYYSGITNLSGAYGQHRFGEIIGAADSFSALMWASFIGSISAIILAMTQRILSLSEAFNAWLAGVKSMVIAMLILALAWAIGDVCLELHTADFVIESIKSIMSPRFLPIITFLTAAFIGFSTGTSWATMAILIPIVIPAATKLTATAGLSNGLSETILIATIGSVLSGSVFGDHCSPISDTTIMSSMASASDHIDHVRTQLPYAILVALVSCIVGYIPAGFGYNILISLIIGTCILLAVNLIFGKKPFPSKSN